MENHNRQKDRLILVYIGLGSAVFRFDFVLISPYKISFSRFSVIN